jgi:hypothetical protein
MGEEKQLIELFVFRYDRPWPSGEPWNVDLTDAFLGFGLVSSGLSLLLALRPVRRLALAGFLAASLVFALWAMNVYMAYAGTHWGMRSAIQAYYEQRHIHGIDIRYNGARQIADEWADFTGQYEIQTVIPEGLAPGQPVTIDIALMGRGSEPER